MIVLLNHYGNKPKWFMPEDDILDSFRVQFQDMLRSNINVTLIKLTVL